MRPTLGCVAHQARPICQGSSEARHLRAVYLRTNCVLSTRCRPAAALRRAALEVRDEPYPVADVEPGADAVPRLRVVGGVGEHLGAGRVGDAAGGQGDAPLVDRVEPGPVGRDPAGSVIGGDWIRFDLATVNVSAARAA